MARQIEAYKLRTELAVDATKGTHAMKAFQKDVDNVGASFKKLGPQIDSALKGKEAGLKFGQSFGASATAAITGSIDSLGQTIGSLIGTAIMPGIGTAVGSTMGSMIDKVGAGLTPIIKQGLELNKMLEATRVEFTTFAGSAKAADEYLDGLKKFAHETGTNLNVVVETSEKLYDLTGNLELSIKVMKAATDQAADFGGSAETITKVADALGLVAEKGELATRDLKGLFKLGIDATKYLSQATGRSEKDIRRLIAAGRIRGAVATRVIAEGIERDKGGFAKTLADTTAGGRERKFGVAMQLAAAGGTENLMRGLGEVYDKADKLLSSEGANKLIDFLNATTGQMIDFANVGIQGGVSLAQGVAEGISGTESFKAVASSVDTFGNYLTTTFKTTMGIESPSQRMIDTVGIPMGQGIAEGISLGFVASFGATTDQIAATLEELLRDPRIVNFLELISKSETGKPRGQATGRLFGPLGTTDPTQFFSATGGWPGMRTFSPSLHRQVYTSPLGGGQIVKTTAKEFSRQTGLNVRMDQHGQDMIMAWLISQKPGALEKIQRGDLAGAMKLLGGTWESFKTYNRPGSTGGARLVSQFSGGASGPVPVVVTNFGGSGGGSGWTQADISGGAKAIFGDSTAGEAEQAVSTLSNFVQTITDTEPVLVDVNVANTELIKTNLKQERALAAMGTVTLKAITPVEDLTGAVQTFADTSKQVTKETQKAVDDELVRAESLRDLIGQRMGQVAGMIPSQQVGKKRGLFSKILGIAAPFLGFIPGVGPILSTIAGAAAAGIGGNWGGAVSTIGAGLTKGGAFNPDKSDEAAATPWADFAKNFKGPRASGGPVYRGHAYLVGERRAEIFAPGANGFIYPSAGGGGAGAAAILAAAAELRAAVAHLNSMPAHHVVMRGAHGLVRAMDRDAGLIRLVSQRQRLA